MFYFHDPESPSELTIKTLIEKQKKSKEKLQKVNIPEMIVINEMNRAKKEDGISQIGKDSASHFSFGKSKIIETE